jgi:hypothetical protein
LIAIACGWFGVGVWRRHVQNEPEPREGRARRRATRGLPVVHTDRPEFSVALPAIMILLILVNRQLKDAVLTKQNYMEIALDP